ncbi:MAG: hypothetical protein IKY66_08775 [Bacteroidales bacterium]|nr:hypothetical protein [Bacteroidales bacterium]
MKGLFNRLLKSLGFSGRDWAVLLLALLLAFSTWLIHNLSLRYNDFLTVPVTAQCSIDGHAGNSANQCKVVARCRTTGYNVIRHNLYGERQVRTVSFKPEAMRYRNDDTYYITASDLQEYSHVIFGDDVTVEYFVSDTLFFNFPSVDHKKVPIVPVYSLSYRDQYTNVGDLKVEPDSVTIYGEINLLDNIEQVYTRPLKQSDLNSDIHGMIALDPVSNVRFSVSEVTYSLDVARYVEIGTEIKVGTINVPSEKDMVVLPSRVEVSLKCHFPLKGNPASSMELYADYEDFLKTVSGKCPVRVVSLPDGVISYDLDPFYVECIVSDK